MDKALKSHKLLLEARQEAYKMRSHQAAESAREESPIFEPERSSAPSTVQKSQQHEKRKGMERTQSD